MLGKSRWKLVVTARGLRWVPPACFVLLMLPAAANAANVTVSGGALTYNGAAGEANTAMIVEQQTTAAGTVYFVGDQNPNVTVTASGAQGCAPTAASSGLPKGQLCTVPTSTPVTSLVANLGDGNDTAIVNSGADGPAGTIDGGAGNDTLVGGRQNDTLRGGSGTDNAAFVGVSAAGISRTANVRAVLPATSSPSTGNGESGENDSIAADVEDLTGGSGDDTLTGNAGANTILGSAPPGTPNFDPQPAGTESTDAIKGNGGNDWLLAGNSGTVAGDGGNDTLVGGRSFASVTTVNGGPGDDTLISGLGSDNLIGGAGSNTLAYESVNRSGVTTVSRNGGVLVRLPEPGTTETAGTIGGQEEDIVHDDLRTLIGSNGADFLVGSDVADTILGAAPVGTGGGVVDSPAGNDTILGRGGDDSLVGGDRGSVSGGGGNDTLVGGRSAAAADKTVIHGDVGNDTIISGLGNDEIIGDAGSNTLAYASFEWRGLDIVNRGINGVTAVIPAPGQTAGGGRTGGTEKDVIHGDIVTLFGSNGNDFLIGNNLSNTIRSVTPAGTAGVKPGPAGNDILLGLGGIDLLFGGEGGDWLLSGAHADVLLSGAGNDILIGEGSADTINAGDGNDITVSRDGLAETVACGSGTDVLARDTLDTTPAGDCETISSVLTPSPLPATFFGVAPDQALIGADYELMDEAGVAAARIVMSWSQVEPVAGAGYNWNRFDQIFRELALRGIEPVPQLFGDPAIVTKVNDQSIMNRWRDFVTAAVSRYEPGSAFWNQFEASNPGVVAQPLRIWEVYNEPNIWTYWPSGPSASAYAKLLDISAGAIRSVDPNAKIMIGGMLGKDDVGGIASWEFMRQLYLIPGAKADFDIVASHPYAFALDYVDYQITRLRETMVDADDASTPIWINEIGWGSTYDDRPNVNSWWERDPQGQAAMLTSLWDLLIAKRSEWNIQGVFWYTWRDPTSTANLCDFCYSNGLLSHSFVEKPSYDAFEAIVTDKYRP